MARWARGAASLEDLRRGSVYCCGGGGNNKKAPPHWVVTAVPQRSKQAPQYVPGWLR